MGKSAGSKILPLREHVVRIYRSAVILKLDNLIKKSARNHWDQMEHNLFLAQSLNSISTDTSYFDPDSGRLCVAWSLFDSLTTRSTNRIILGSIRFTLLWTAFECLIKTWSDELAINVDLKQRGGGALKQREAGTFKALMAKLDSTLSISPDLKRARNAAIASCRIVGDMENVLASVSMTKDGPRNEDTFAYCAELVRAFRNHIAHGNEVVPWPDNEAVHAQCLGPVQRAIIARHKNMSRLLLMLMQACLACDLDASIVARAGRDYEFEEVLMPLRQFILEAHTVGCGTEFDLCYYDGPSVDYK